MPNLGFASTIFFSRPMSHPEAKSDYLYIGLNCSLCSKPFAKCLVLDKKDILYNIVLWIPNSYNSPKLEKEESHSDSDTKIGSLWH